MITALLDAAVAARAPLFDDAHETAFRLFNGFSEGVPALSLEVYQRCLVLHDYTAGGDAELMAQALAIVRERLPWITSALAKPRDKEARMLLGSERELPTRVLENGVWYALRLLLNKDTSFYLDTRSLRAWAKANLKGKRVLNTFAHTGSLGVAARAAPSAQVVSTDASKRFLSVMEASLTENGFGFVPRDSVVGDIFSVVARLKRVKALFDCVFLDPPFFSRKEQGVVDLQAGMGALINKVRPLVAHEGALVLVNNALFVSGAELKRLLDGLCETGYMQIETLLDVPEDCRGYLIKSAPVSDPAPFNHATKIAVLRVRRKDGRGVQQKL